MKRLASFVFCALLAVSVFGCVPTKTDGGSDGRLGDLTLTVEDADKSVSITAAQSYKLKYAVNYGAVSVAVLDVEGNAVTEGANYNADSKLFTAQIAPKTYKLRVSASYGGQVKAEKVVTVEVTPAVTEGNGGGEEEVKKLNYPVNPNFNPLQARPDNYRTWTEFGAHDPSLIQVDGVYYAFSTDVASTQNGYQIRSSYDAIHWKYIGSAFKPSEVAPAAFLAGTAAIQEAFNEMKNNNADTCANAATGEVTLWAPDVVKGDDGKFWLYYCLTSNFGSSKSYLGLAKSDFITGPYRHDSKIISTSASGGGQVNPLDPQIIYEKGDASDRNNAMYMTYGSFMAGVRIQKLDRATGRVTADMPTDIAVRSSGFGAEGSVMTYNNGYYYLFMSAGALATTYNMRCFRSESITGPFLGINESAAASGLISATAAGGDKVMGAFRFLYNDPNAANQPADVYAPGHNDLFTDANGVNLVAYHARCQKVGDNMHYLYTSQYFFNEDERLVVNPNRYAGDGEALRKLTAGEILGTEGELAAALSAGGYNGAYKMIQLATNSTATVDSTLVRLTADGKVLRKAVEADVNPDEGIALGDEIEKGSWTLTGDYYVTVNVTEGGDTVVYKGVAVPTWLTDQNLPGITMTLLNSQTGAAMYLNMARV